MGVKVQDAQRGFIYCEADRLKGCDVQLDYPSVGATENIMLASVFADGETIIRNAAKEPEILDLQNYLQATGVQVTGAGTSVIRVRGGDHRLRNAEHTIITDRIVTGTYMAAAGITGGELVLRNVIPEHLSSIISLFGRAGLQDYIRGSTMQVNGPARLRAIDIVRNYRIRDFQRHAGSAGGYAHHSKRHQHHGRNGFENRYKHVDELAYGS